MEQVNITDQNRQFYYKAQYNIDYVKNNLINLGSHANETIVAVDSCGYLYRNHFSDLTLQVVENSQMVKLFNLDHTYYDKLFDSLESITVVRNGVLLLDHCPSIFKYKTLDQLVDVISTLTKTIDPKYCIGRIALITLADNRLADRFKSLSQIIPDNYIVCRYCYDFDYLTFEIQRKITS